MSNSDSDYNKPVTISSEDPNDPPRKGSLLSFLSNLISANLRGNPLGESRHSRKRVKDLSYTKKGENRKHNLKRSPKQSRKYELGDEGRLTRHTGRCEPINLKPGRAALYMHSKARNRHREELASAE